MNTTAKATTGYKNAEADNDGSVWGDIATGLFGAGATVAGTYLAADAAAQAAANEQAARSERLSMVLKFMLPALLVTGLVVVIVAMKKRK